MTLGELKDHIMFQTNNDAEDIEDYIPYVVDYINEGYDLLISAWSKKHIVQSDYQRLTDDTDVPKLPEWTHRAIADWATWLLYRNGNPQKQQRGMTYRLAFQEVVSKISDEGGAAGLDESGNQKRYRNFYNIPV